MPASASTAGRRRRRLRRQSGLKTLRVVPGCVARAAGGRVGRGTRFPPQLGQIPASRPSAQGTQNVHSYEQMRASTSGGRSASQHSQFGLSSSIGDPSSLVTRRPFIHGGLSEQSGQA